MIARWGQGRTTIDALLAERRLDRVAPSTELADTLLDQAHRHLETAVPPTSPTTRSGQLPTSEAVRSGAAPALA